MARGGHLMDDAHQLHKGAEARDDDNDDGGGGGGGHKDNNDSASILLIPFPPIAEQ